MYRQSYGKNIFLMLASNRTFYRHFDKAMENQPWNNQGKL